MVDDVARKPLPVLRQQIAPHAANGCAPDRVSDVENQCVAVVNETHALEKNITRTKSSVTVLNVGFHTVVDSSWPIISASSRAWDRVRSPAVRCAQPGRASEAIVGADGEGRRPLR